MYFWADPFVNLNVKFGWEKGIFEENVFSNICSTHKNAPKKYPTISKFEKKKNMTCPTGDRVYKRDCGTGSKIQREMNWFGFLLFMLQNW